MRENYTSGYPPAFKMRSFSSGAPADTKEMRLHSIANLVYGLWKEATHEQLQRVSSRNAEHKQPVVSGLSDPVLRLSSWP